MDTQTDAVPPAGASVPVAADPASTVTPATNADDLAPDTGQRFDRARTTRFGVGFFAYGLLWIIGLQIVAAVLLPQRLKDIGVASPETLLGSISAVTAIVSLVSNLVFGNFSDRTRSRFGRRAPWILAGGILGGVTLLAIGLLSDATLITIVYCVCMVGLNMMLAPAVAVLSDRVPGKLRGTMSAFYGAGLSAGAPLGSLVGTLFIGATGASVPGFVLAGALMAFSAVLALVIWPRERSARDLPPAPSTLKDVLASFRPPRNAPDFYLAFGGRLFMLVSYQMIMAYQLYIVQDHLGQTTEESAATIATMSVILLVVSLVGAVVAGPVSDVIGRRKLPVVLSSVMFAVGIAMPWIMPTTLGMYLFAGIAGLGYGIYTSVDQALNVDVLPNQEEAGKDLGILNLSTTAGQTVGPLITSSLVVATGSYSLVFPVAIVAALLGALAIVRIRSVH
ncbi:MFS transporter [Puerhibacterium puerhi]|uniref:MFS transporter n=1 Tax=Puerhibacterium puerhi TaxID=2692623 RepID=UPI001357FAFE|nr:MFS transporter [Puerhibacterium puerhi]